MPSRGVSQRDWVGQSDLTCELASDRLIVDVRMVSVMNDRIARLRAFEGRRVSLVLAGGSRIDDCEVVSAALGAAGSVWVLRNGVDTFVPVGEVVDWWEVPRPRRSAPWLAVAAMPSASHRPTL
jgi:hypothetical protein